MEEQPKVIEVEVESSTVDEVKVEDKPTRVKSDYSRQIRFFGRLSSMFFSICSPLFFMGLVVGLVFSILYTDYQQLYALIMLSTGFSFASLALVGVILGFIFRYIMRGYKKRDPNFSDTLGSDEVYE